MKKFWFVHATITKMKKLFKNANLFSDEICKIIGDVVTCNTCARLK